jgi:hypothetical protein
MDAADPWETAPATEPIELANEYTAVQVRVVQGRNGVRLEIVAPRLGRGIRLDPLQLESLTWQPPETFSEFLRTPFGPEPEREREPEREPER